FASTKPRDERSWLRRRGEAVRRRPHPDTRRVDSNRTPFRELAGAAAEDGDAVTRRACEPARRQSEVHRPARERHDAAERLVRTVCERPQLVAAAPPARADDTQVVARRGK